MTKEIEGKLVASLVYLESGNVEGAKEEIEDVVELFEIDRLKKTKKKPTMVRLSKRGAKRSKKNTM